MSMVPVVVSMWDLTTPPPKGTSVTTWFIRMGSTGGCGASRCCSRISRAASIHLSLRKG